MSRSPTPIDKRIGVLLAGKRRSLSLSQHAVASRLSISYQQVQKYENGSNRVAASTLLALGRVLNFSAADFLREIEASGPARPYAGDGFQPPERVSIADGC